MSNKEPGLEEAKAIINRLTNALLDVTEKDNLRAAKSCAQEALFPSLRRWKEDDE